jgi:hypothetical protein
VKQRATGAAQVDPVKSTPGNDRREWSSRYASGSRAQWLLAGWLVGWLAASSAICFLSDKQQKKFKKKTQPSATHTLISRHWVLLLEEETICFFPLWSCVDVIIILCCSISFAHIVGSCNLIVVVTLQDFGLLCSGKPRN